MVFLRWELLPAPQIHTLKCQEGCDVPGQVSIHSFLNFSNQWHHHNSKRWRQGLLGEHAKPDNPSEEGGGAETTSNLLQRGHAQVSGLWSWEVVRCWRWFLIGVRRCVFFNCAQVSCDGPQSVPLNLAVSWRCEPTSTDLRIDYKYNGGAMAMPMALNNVQFLVPVDGGVTKLQAVLPPAVWYGVQVTSVLAASITVVCCYYFFSLLFASFGIFNVLFLTGTRNRKESFGKFLIFHRNLKTVVCPQTVLSFYCYFQINYIFFKSTIKNM